MNGDSGLHGGRVESTREGDRVPQRLEGPELVDGRPQHLARDDGEPAVDRNEHHVAGLQPDIGGIAAVEEVIVEVEAVHQGAAAPDLHVAEAAIHRRAPGGVQRGEHGPGARHLIRARADDVTGHVDLDAAEPRERKLEAGRSVGPAAHPRVHPAQPHVELVLELGEREVGDVHLTDLRNDDKPFAGNRKGGRSLHVAGEDEHQHIAGPEPVVLVHRAGLRWLEPRGGPPEGLDPEELEAGTAQHGDRIGQRVGARRVGPEQMDRVEHCPERIGQDAGRVYQPERVRLNVAQHAQRLDGVHRPRSQLGGPSGVRALEVVIQHVLRVSGGAEPGPHLVRRKPGLLQSLAELLDELRVLQELLGLLR